MKSYTMSLFVKFAMLVFSLLLKKRNVLFVKTTGKSMMKRTMNVSNAAIFSPSAEDVALMKENLYVMNVLEALNICLLLMKF